MRAAVASIAQIAEGDVLPVRINGVEVLVCQVYGQFYAVGGRCPHAQQTLAGGRLAGHELKCPLHGARFDVRNGHPVTGPARTPIPCFPVTLEGGKVWVDVG